MFPGGESPGRISFRKFGLTGQMPRKPPRQRPPATSCSSRRQARDPVKTHPALLSLCCAASGLWLGSAAPLRAAPAWKFDFGPGAAAPGYVRVPAGATYTDQRGYGFDFGFPVRGVQRAGPDPLRDDFVTSDHPFFFSVKVPEGNYRVTLILGDPDGTSVTTVKAESRRLMLEKVSTARGEFATRTIIVNVRTPELPPPPRNAPGGDHVLLDSWERSFGPDGIVLDWDHKLTLEFDDRRPCVCGLEIARVTGLPTVYLAGDSTVTDQPRGPTTSWGQMLPRFFRPVVAVSNQAESGETLKSFLTELRLAKILSQIRPGDYLFIQFAHNDEKKNWPQTYVAARTTYQAYLRVYIAEARLRGAIPVLVTPMQRRVWGPDGKIRNTHGDYPEAMREVAREEHVALIDLEPMSRAFYEALGRTEAPLAFGSRGRDLTHQSAYGAYELAKCVAEGIQRSGLPLAADLVPGFKGFDPAHPDAPAAFDVPATPLTTRQRPRGS
jgi:lysophospholipase L1-like esterase